MKKIIHLSVLTLITFFAKAQTAKNNWLVGGAVDFTSSTQKYSDAFGSSTTSTFALQPDIGYFIVNNLAAGINLNFSASDYGSSFNNGGVNSSTSTNIYAGPLVRYYFNTGSPNVKIFVQGDASWGTEMYSYAYTGGIEQHSPNVPISIYDGKAGAAFFLNSNVALEFAAGYQSIIEKVQTVKSTNNSIFFGLGFQVYLGSAKNNPPKH